MAESTEGATDVKSGVEDAEKARSKKAKQTSSLAGRSGGTVDRSSPEIERRDSKPGRFRQDREAGSMGTKQEGEGTIAGAKEAAALRLLYDKDDAVSNPPRDLPDKFESADAFTDFMKSGEIASDAFGDVEGGKAFGADPRQGARAIDQYKQERQAEKDAEAAEATADLRNVDEIVADTEGTSVDPESFAPQDGEIGFDTPIEGDATVDPDALTDEQFLERYGSTREEMEASDAEAPASAPAVLPPDEVEDLEPLQGRALRRSRRQLNRKMRMDGMGAGPAARPVAGAAGSKDDPAVAEAIAPSLTDEDDAAPAAAPRTSPGPTRQGGGLFRNNMMGRIRQQRRKVNQMARAAQSEEELAQVQSEMEKLNELKDLRQSKRGIRKAARGRRSNVFRDLTEDAAAKALEKEAESEETEEAEEKAEGKKSPAPPPEESDAELTSEGTTGLVVDADTGEVTDTDLTSENVEIAPTEAELDKQYGDDLGEMSDYEPQDASPEAFADKRETDAAHQLSYAIENTPYNPGRGDANPVVDQLTRALGGDATANNAARLAVMANVARPPHVSAPEHIANMTKAYKLYLEKGGDVARDAMDPVLFSQLMNQVAAK